MDAVSATLLVAIVASLSGLSGVWLGALLTRQNLTQYRAAEWREHAKEREIELRDIRSLLRLEIQHNLEILKELQDHLYAHRDDQEPDFQALSHFMVATLPAWGRFMFDDLAPRLPQALTLETIKRVYAFHWQLARLNTLQQVIRAKMPPHLAPNFFAWLEQYHQEHAHGHTTSIANWADYTEFTQFKADILDTWNECYGIVNGLILGGNPIPEQ